MTVNKKETPLSRLLFDDVERINFDQDYWFQLRGSSANCFIDAATPLLGLSLRVRSLAQCPTIEAIYDQTVEEIKAIDIELTEQGIDHPTLMAYRYVLCAYLDEAVMGTEWGFLALGQSTQCFLVSTTRLGGRKSIFNFDSLANRAGTL